MRSLLFSSVKGYSCCSYIVSAPLGKRLLGGPTCKLAVPYASPLSVRLSNTALNTG